MDRFAGMAHHLREKIAQKLHHLWRDTKEFVDDLRRPHWQDEMRMVKIDIKEFYMSGAQLEFLPDLTYRVTTGSGLGLLHSSDVSDAGFWIAAERWLLNTSVRRWCSLTYWRRFRDDIFAIATNNFPRFKLFFLMAPLVQLARDSSSRQKVSAKARLPS